MPKKEMKTRFLFLRRFFFFHPTSPYFYFFTGTGKMSMAMGNDLNQTKVEERDLKKRKKESKSKSYDTGLLLFFLFFQWAFGGWPRMGVQKGHAPQFFNVSKVWRRANNTTMDEWIHEGFEPQLFRPCSGKCSADHHSVTNASHLVSFPLLRTLSRSQTCFYCLQTTCASCCACLFRPSRHTPTQTKTQPIDSQVQSMVPELCFAIHHASLPSVLILILVLVLINTWTRE